ncbi:MAG: MBL fold metallo-hydrolase [Oxalobacter formigenes]|nr:MBL fold metallo-hydrolase [Oxalobacter formigenes]
MKKTGKMILAGIFLAILSVTIAVFVILGQRQFGRQPKGDSLNAIMKSPHYVKGEFKNLSPTPLFTEDTSIAAVLLKSFFTAKERRIPKGTIPSVKTNLHLLDPKKNLIVWLGHSSYYIQLSGRRFLIDPVLHPYAGPFSFVNSAFKGSHVYTPEDMPVIDYLLISHDHWDHLDYETVTALEPRVKSVITGLGVGAHLIYWGYPAQKIHEADWYDQFVPEEGIRIHILPARHFSGRGLIRNKTLWVSFAIQTANRKIFFSGDSGYGPHFAEAGKYFGGFDLVILENGQYDKLWAYIHMTPEETAQAAADLKANALLPAHSGKFALSNHAWNDPLARLLAASKNQPYRLLTPIIGDTVNLSGKTQHFSFWWETLE